MHLRITGAAPRSAALAAALAALPACQDSTGSQAGPDLTLEVTAYTSDTHLLVTQDGAPAVGCNFAYSVNPTGDAGASAAWAGATLRFFAGAGRTTAFDSLVLTAQEMNETFGAEVRAGTRQSGSVGFLATVPYGMEAEFRYTVRGSNRGGAAKVYAPCLVPAQDLGSPPAISGLQVSVTPGLPLEAGDIVRVSWTASSTTGLWESGVVLTGGFQARYRAGVAHQKSRSFTAEFVVPRGALLGEPVRVHAYAVDLLVRPSPTLSEVAGAVGDVTAPELHAISTGSPGTVFPGSFESGRPVDLHLDARDRGRLDYVVYELGPVGAAVRDSVALDTVGPYRVALPTREAWRGEGELRVYVRDNAGNRSRVLQSAPGDVHFHGVLPVRSSETTVGYEPAGHAVDAARGRVAVAARTQPRVFIYALPELAQVASVELAWAAQQVDVAPGGQVVALARGQSSLAFIDPAGQRPVRYVALDAAAVDSLYGFRITATGQVMVLARRSGGTGTVVLQYDLATGVPRVRTDAPAVPFPGAGVAASLDRSRLLLGAGCVYRADTDAFGACAPLWHGGDYGGGPFRGSGTGAYWADAARVFDASLRLVRQGRVGALSADDRYAYADDYDRIRRVRISDGIVEDAFASFLRGPTHVSADGRLLVSLEIAGVTNNRYHLRVDEIP